ncbi:uncharacterized protein LOC133445660 [Cololabis saira]|uniref:uncharacterized protein LOC133445660 n=1 Tax=Cololabis saira TaxID=129043 RepID=UPI002AD3ED04|nr:uncharacterized protein LOC133445660 [Cololabis saira]
MSGYKWAEDDFMPPGVCRLLTPQPENNRTYMMYHGTTRANARAIRRGGFHQSKGGMLGPGVYLSRDLEKAKRYPIDWPENDKVVIKVKVNVGKVIAISHQGHPLQKTWSDGGYDAAWVPPSCGMVKSGLEENCIWDPKRISIIDDIKPVPHPYRDAAANMSGDKEENRIPLRRGVYLADVVKNLPDMSLCPNGYTPEIMLAAANVSRYNRYLEENSLCPSRRLSLNDFLRPVPHPYPPFYPHGGYGYM